MNKKKKNNNNNNDNKPKFGLQRKKTLISTSE